MAVIQDNLIHLLTKLNDLPDNVIYYNIQNQQCVTHFYALQIATKLEINRIA